jgi:hypothetical protein
MKDEAPGGGSFPNGKEGHMLRNGVLIGFDAPTGENVCFSSNGIFDVVKTFDSIVPSGNL